MKLEQAKDYLINLQEMKTMTREVLLDIDKAVSHAVDRLMSDEGLTESEAKRFVNNKLSAIMKNNH